MAAYLVRKLGVSLITIFGIVVIVFLIVRVLPGDAAAVRAGPYADEERIAQLRTKYGLDEPLPEQFTSYVGGVLKGDLGVSVRTDRPVLQELLARLPASLELALYSGLAAIVIGVPLGILAAAYRGTWVDTVARIIGVFGSSMALFWLGLLLIFFGFYRFGWFPGPVDRLGVATPTPDRITGFYTIDALLAGDLSTAWEAARYLMLPVTTLAFILTAPILKMVR